MSSENMQLRKKIHSRDLVKIVLTALCLFAVINVRAETDYYPAKHGTVWTYAEFYQGDSKPGIGLVGFREVEIVYRGNIDGRAVIIRQKRDYLVEGAHPFPKKIPNMTGIANEVIERTGNELKTLVNYHYSLTPSDKDQLRRDGGIIEGKQLYKKILNEMTLATRELVNRRKKESLWLWQAGEMSRAFEKVKKTGPMSMVLYYPIERGGKKEPHEVTIETINTTLIRYPLEVGREWTSGQTRIKIAQKEKRQSTLGNRIWDTYMLTSKTGNTADVIWLAPALGEVIVASSSDKPDWDVKAYELIEMKNPPQRQRR